MFITPSRSFVYGIAALPWLVALSGAASASAFQILEQSPAQLGKAFAGTGSDVVDASTVYFNPAGMTQLEGRVLTGGLNGIFVRSEFQDGGSTTGGQTGETDEPGYLPNIYYVHPLNERMSLGVGVNAPFGLASAYNDGWIGRYLATNSELEVVNVGVNFAYAITDQLSAAVGVNFQSLDVVLESRVDSTFGVAPDPATDSSAYIRGDDSAFAFDLSLFYQPLETTTMGLVWRQGAEFSLSGEAEFEFNELCAPGAGFPTGAPPAPTTGTVCAETLTTLAGNVEADVDLPDTLTLSASHQLTDQLTVHGDIARTQWDSIETIEIVNVENGAPVNTLELHYSNTTRYSLGVSYNNNSPWTWRAGVARDEAPQTDPTLVTPRIPDEDRTWLSAGFNYALSDMLSFDFGYTHLLVDDTDIHHVDPQTGRQVVGHFESSVDIIGVQANWYFK